MDQDRQHEGDVFAVPDLSTNTVPDLEALLDQHTLLRGIDFDIPAIKLDNPYTRSNDFALKTSLIDLDNFEYGAFPPLDDILDGSVASLSSDEQPSTSLAQEDLQDDIWQLANDLGPLANDTKLLTWESFLNPSHTEPAPAFLSEAGPAAFDAALRVRRAESDNDLKDGRVLQSNPLLRSLWQLGLGRPSVLFPYDMEKREFGQAIHDGRMSGYSLASSQSVNQEFLRIGSAMVGLRAFVEGTYNSPVVSPALVALASAVRVVCEATEDHLVRGFGPVRSLLQLQALFRMPVVIQSIIQDLVEKAGSGGSNEEIATLVFKKTQQHESSDHVYEIMLQILARVSRPLFDSLEERIGLRQRRDGKRHPRLDLQEQEDDSLMDSNGPHEKAAFPEFLSEADQHLVIESQKCLEFMQDNNPGHPLCKINTGPGDSAELVWGFHWANIQRISSKAAAYEERLISEVAKYDRNESNSISISTEGPSSREQTLNYYTGSNLDNSNDIDASILTLNELTNLPSQFLPDEMFSVVTRSFCEPDVGSHHAASLSPSMSRIPHLSLHPFLSVQHRLLTSACLRSVILDHSLRTHLDLVRSFQLCASGLFTSRLVDVLFSPEFESVERQRDTLRSGSSGMGLKLGSGERREWPPASSELTIALRGVLSETWKASLHEAVPLALRTPVLPSSVDQAKSSVNGRESLLPGGLSFALRVNLSQHEIERILDPHSVYALDFLRLSYEPPPALAAVFTPRSLAMYDRVFRALLRTLRVEFVMAQSFRDTLVLGRQSKRYLSRRAGEEQETEMLTQRFRHDAGYFVNTLTAYFIYTAVGKPWHRFRKYFDMLEQHLQCMSIGEEQVPDMPRDTRAHTPDFSLAALIAMHESTLSTITTSLLLRKRQSKAADLLEDICGEILGFAKMVRERSTGSGIDAGESNMDIAALSQLHDRFTRHVGEFTHICGRFSENTKGRIRDEGAEAIRELVETLEDGAVAYGCH